MGDTGLPAAPANLRFVLLLGMGLMSARAVPDRLEEGGVIGVKDSKQSVPLYRFLDHPHIGGGRVVLHEPSM